MISLWPQNKQLLTSMVLRLCKFSIKPRVCSFLVTRFMWLKIWVQLVLDARLHPFPLESIFTALLVFYPPVAPSLERRDDVSAVGVFIFSLSWNGPYSFRPSLTLGTRMLNVSRLPAELKFLIAPCIALCLIIVFTGNLFCLMLVQSPFLWIGVLLGRFFCSFLFILTTQLCLKRDSCRQHMAISCFPNLFQKSLS